MAANAQEYCDLHINVEAASPTASEESAGAKLIKKFSDGFGLKKLLSTKAGELGQQYEEGSSSVTKASLERRIEREKVGGSHETSAVADFRDSLEWWNKESDSAARSNLALPSGKLFKKFSRDFAATSSGADRKTGENGVVDDNLASEAPVPSTKFRNRVDETTASPVQAPAEYRKATLAETSSAAPGASVLINPVLVEMEKYSAGNNEDFYSASSAAGVLKNLSSALKVRAAPVATTFPPALPGSFEPSEVSARLMATSKNVPAGSTETPPFSVKAEASPACNEEDSGSEAPATEPTMKLSSALKWSKGKTSHDTTGVAQETSSEDHGVSTGGPVPLLNISPAYSKHVATSSAQGETAQSIAAAKIELVPGRSPVAHAETQLAAVEILAAAAKVQAAAAKVQKAAAIVQTAASAVRTAAAELQRTNAETAAVSLSAIVVGESRSTQAKLFKSEAISVIKPSGKSENDVQYSGLIKKISDNLNVMRLFKQISSPENGTKFQRLLSPVSNDGFRDADHAEEQIKSSQPQSTVDGMQTRAQKTGSHASLLMKKMSAKCDLRALGGIGKSGAQRRIPEAASPVSEAPVGGIINTDVATSPHEHRRGGRRQV